MAKPAAVKKPPVNRRLIAGVTLCIALILTVVFLWLGITGRNMDAQGLYKLLPWLPVPTQGTLWRDALAPGASLGDTLTLTLMPGSDDANPDLEGAARVIAKRIHDLGWVDSAAVVDGGSIAVTIPHGVEETSLRAFLSTRGEYTFADPTGTVFLTGDHITSALYGYADASGQTITLNFVLDAPGADTLKAKYTEFAGDISILRDGVVLDSSVTLIADGGAVSFSGFTLDAARENALLMRSGALPLALTAQGEGVQSAALLGSSAQTALLIALLALLFLASIYLIACFRVAGAVAVWMLVLQVALSYFFAALMGVGFTLLTLAGVWVPFVVSFFAFVNLLGSAQTDLLRGRSIRQALKESHAGRGHASLDAFAALVLACVVLIIMNHGTIRVFCEVFTVSLLVAVTLTHIAARLLLGEAIHLVGGDAKLYSSTGLVRKEA